MIKLMTTLMFAIVLTGCVSTDWRRQSAASSACTRHGGDVTYNTLSVTCRLPNGRSFTVY